jgi:tight adherence protein B
MPDMTSMPGLLVFLAMVFVAVFLLSQGLVVPLFGEGNKMRKRLKQRLDELEAVAGEAPIESLLREQYMKQLSPWERSLESLPFLDNLRQSISQAGFSILAYRLVLIAFSLSIVGGVLGWSLSRMIVGAIGCAILGFSLPFLRVATAKRDRMAAFEEQMPAAIDAMKRALRAGHPLSSTFKLVAEDMEDPIAKEFELTFADINYGNDLRRAMLGMLQRVPSLTVMALVTAILVQKETGGNLAEILDQISKVVRGRFKFQRLVRTLSAEGRMSAWVLGMIPLLLFAVISFTTPTYLPVLLEHPVGRQLIAGGMVLAFIGFFWIRKVIQIEA